MNKDYDDNLCFSKDNLLYCKKCKHSIGDHPYINKSYMEIERPIYKITVSRDYNLCFGENRQFIFFGKKKVFVPRIRHLRD